MKRNNDVTRKTVTNNKNAVMFDEVAYDIPDDFDRLVTTCIVTNGVNDGAISSINTYVIISDNKQGFYLFFFILFACFILLKFFELYFNIDINNTSYFTTSPANTATSQSNKTAVLPLGAWIGIVAGAFIIGTLITALVAKLILKKFYMTLIPRASFSKFIYYL